MKLFLVTLVLGLFFFVQQLPQARDSVETRGAHLGGALGGNLDATQPTVPGNTSGGISGGEDATNSPDTGWKSKPQTGEI